MSIKTQILLIIGLTAIVWSASLYIYGLPFDWAFIRFFATATTIVTIFAVIFERYWWKLPIINSYAVNRPLLSGTWKTQLTSNYKDANGNPVSKIVYVAIKQTMTTLSVRMYTDKARSFSITENVRRSDNDGLYDLAIVYQNVPDIEHRQNDGKSRIHFGALHLSDIPRKPTSMKGPYWTDRETNGRLSLIERRSAAIHSYEEGVKLFSVPKGPWWRFGF